MANSNNASYWSGATDPLLQSIAERSYYAIPGAIKNKIGTSGDAANDLSQNRAQTRGAQYAQERRINQIRSNRGDQTAFDPKTMTPGAPTAQETAWNNFYLPKVADVGGDHGQNLVRGGTTAVGAISNSLQGDKNNVQGQLNDLQPYMQNRYTADATRAGTLSNTDQSQASLNADVNAGMEGAKTALNSQLSILNDATTNNFRQNQIITPPAGGVGTSTAGASVNPGAFQQNPLNSPIDSIKPENQMAAAPIASGQTGVTPQARMQAIQAKRAR